MRDQDNAEKFEKAGAQAAQLFGRFVDLATEISRDFNDTPVATNDSNQGSSDERTVNTGEQLRKFRESAGYTLEGFAKALEEQLDQGDIKHKLTMFESGQAELPAHWSKAIAAILATAGASGPASTTTSLRKVRQQRLAGIFEDDESLEELSDDEFEKLLNHVENAYLSAKSLLNK